MSWNETAQLNVGHDRIEVLLARPQAPRPGHPVLLIVHGHQFPDRPGARGAMPESAVFSFTEAGWTLAAVSQPGYGGSTGPPDMCGPRTQAAIRAAFAQLVACGSDPKRSVVWGISRGAVACACAFVSGSEPALLILQAGTYDLAAWVDWVEAGAPGGDLDTARAILVNQRREAGESRTALDVRSGVHFADKCTCDVLLVHGGQDPQGPLDDLHAMQAALRGAGRNGTVAVEPETGHRLTKGFALRAARRLRPDLAIP